MRSVQPPPPHRTKGDWPSIEPHPRNDHRPDCCIQFFHQFRLHHTEVGTQGRALQLHEQGLVTDELFLRIACHHLPGHTVPRIQEPLLQQRGLQSALAEELVEDIVQRLYLSSEHRLYPSLSLISPPSTENSL